MAIEQSARRVLVVDDSEIIRRVLRLILQGEGYLVEVAASGASALALARQLRPDAMTLDLGLPDQDGREVLRRLKEDPLTRGIPVVVISAHPDALGDQERARAAHVIVKPFDVDTLLDGVGHALGLNAAGPASRVRPN
jgi:CheY-like chemotaxis protein